MIEMKNKTHTKTVKKSTNLLWGLYGRFIAIILIIAIEGVKLEAQHSNLHEFVLDNAMSNPITQLAADDNILYGMTSNGGIYNKGAIFRINKDGTGFRKLLDFDETNNGADPRGSLTISGSVLYGMTYSGGTNGYGIIFKMNTDGSGFQKLLDFDGTNNGANPRGSLTISGSVLYGTTYRGGAYGYGVIFKMNTDGSGFQKLLDLGTGVGAAYPSGSLALSGSSLYGMTIYAGANAKGVIFRINTDGSGFTKLFDFDGTNSGANPYGSLVVSGTKLYGMTTYGGTDNLGCLFSINTNGSNYTKLLDFDGTDHGARPYGSLFIYGTKLYGMTYYGGTKNKGCVFSINIDGTGFLKKWNFSDTELGGYDNNGISPSGSPILIGNEIIGMTAYGGFDNAGILFRIYDQSIGSSDGVYRKLRDFHAALEGTFVTGDLVTDGTILYGTAWDGGANNKGTVFKINIDGTGFQDIYHFNTDINGYTPTSVILSGTTLYGMTHDGGSNNGGIIFKMNTDGTGFQKLLDFDGTNTGAVPYGKLTLSGTTLYGTTAAGGSNNMGTVFKITTDGTGFQKLTDFDGTNNGSYPTGSLTLSGMELFGTTFRGGSYDLGTIFKINADGSGFQKLHDFDGNEGANPRGGSLTFFGPALYGMTENGGANGMGVIFRINTDGTEFQKLLDFDSINNGAHPAYASLTVVESSLYGIVRSGGTNGDGIIFKINPDGTNFQKEYDFISTDGSTPSNSLLLVNSSLYGSTFHGGTDNIGVIYKHDLVILQTWASGGSLTCTTPAVNLDVTSNINEVTYLWSGPEGFSSSDRNPGVNIPGTYVVTVTYGGVSKSDTAVVIEDKETPDLTTSVSGNITCNTFSVALSASSSATGVLFGWTSPAGYNSNQPTTQTTIPGNYTVTAFNPLNGCTSANTVAVLQNIAEPEAVTATVQDILSCTQTSIMLNGSSGTSGVTWEWSGPDNFVSTEQNPLVTKPGNYSLLVTDPVNGCSSSASVSAEQDTAHPSDVTATVSGILTCADTTVTLTGSSGSGEVIYSWSDPNGVYLTGNPVAVSIPGTYILTVTNTVNGCSESTSVTVEQDTEAPAGLTASASGVLSCTVPSVVLSASSTSGEAIYQWEGPSGFTSNEQYTVTGIPGTYSVTATDPLNGCTSAEQVVVNEEECQEP